ncbi:hypothetical protein bsdtb5_07810 [Anaeromicropila herbilytica]|uniref:HTH araC/xylS-type domain-containing protein n=2 Tax=Anaeromicropila herbilytica TaxID=2785025 RepID=A0A7R7EII5_9FIRM|nr:hypothetical protein bsdtb5_07810 [Anaeromicropila herbilytica]
MNSESKLERFLFEQRENDQIHKSYEEELEFYEMVKNGDVKAIEQYTILYMTNDMSGFGVLSKDPLRNLVYHFIVLAAMLTRFCIEGGMSPETSYSLSDLYIQEADHCHNVKEIQTLHCKMVMDYTVRMQRLHTDKIFSKQIVKCNDFIGKSLHQHITIKELAVQIGMNESYLSKLFIKEMGVSVSEYIRQMKIEAASNMLKYSDYTCSEISQYLAFSSQSHFIKVYKEHTGLTPREYRNKYYRHNWS